MCLVTEQKEPKILGEDLIVYKIVDEFYYSPFFGKIFYRKNCLKKAKIEIWEKGEQIHRAIVYGDLLALETYDDKLTKNPENYIIIDQGFHSMKTKTRAQITLDGLSTSFKSRKIVQFLIPAGSEYYEDSTGLIVSNQIMRTHD